jgi:hypothetical protein
VEEAGCGSAQAQAQVQLQFANDNVSSGKENEFDIYKPNLSFTQLLTVILFI